MATLHPFRALRPAPDFAAEIACVPYDVINTVEARQLAAGKPLSFLHVIRPEIDLAEGTDEHDPAVYEKGAENLRKYASSNYALRDREPSLYVYRLVMNGRVQTGIFACVAVSEYDDNTIVKHEKTRIDKEDDRTRHILTQRAHAEPIMLTFRDDASVVRLMEEAQNGTPLYDLTSEDQVRHTIWNVNRAPELVEAFKSVERLYVADGHHRCKAASRTAAALREKGGEIPPEVDYFPAVLFPMGQMYIMPYNRIIKRLPVSPDAFLKQLKERFDVRPSETATPGEKGSICVYFGDKWYHLRLPQSSSGSVVDRLDVGRLTRHILEPMLQISDPRTDPNIDFVGGIRGTDELERLVDSAVAQMAISMYPTSIQELVEVSDAGLLMPPKSTWFEPKLRSGFLVHLFEE